MEKRIDRKKQQGEGLIHRLQKVLAVFFCIALLVFFISVTDMSTRRMIMCTDDKYAMAVSLQEGNILRLDIAGEKLTANIEPVIKVSDFITSNVKRYYNSIAEIVKSKL